MDARRAWPATAIISRMNPTLPAWVEKAAVLPIAFAQVREDPLVDRWVVERIGANAHVAMIASGGCTAALLAAMPEVGRLHLVDPNPAQLALARLKLRLLQTANADERAALLGHAPMNDRSARLREHLAALDLGADALGPLDTVAALGPDHAGRYERCFAELTRSLADQADALDALLRLRDPVEQARRVESTTPLGRRMDEALDEVLALPNLVRLFGAEATNNPVEPFARHFARRIRHVLATLPAADNPYLWQMLKGCYPAVRIPWLDTWRQDSDLAVVHDRQDRNLAATTTRANGFMADALQAEPAAFDFVHLSNILDWLTPEKATHTLDVAARALRPGGWTLIRQLNSTLDIPALGPMFEWHVDDAARLHGADRSFFYRGLHLGRKR